MKTLIYEAGYNQSSLALVMGLDQTTIGKWANGISYPRGETLLTLASLLGCSTDAILQSITQAKQKRTA